MPGKDPHRPQGKTPDMEHARRAHDADINDPQAVRVPGPAPPSRYPAEEQVGGSRPGVESRVKRAIDEREGRS